MAGCPTPAPALAPGDDAVWRVAVAHYRKTYATWLSKHATADKLRVAAMRVLPPKPQMPGSNLPDNIEGMTIAQIKATADDPAYKTAWATYERDGAAWERALLGERQRNGADSASAHADAAFQAYSAALDDLVAYPVRTLDELAEKVEIVSDEYLGDNLPDECVEAMLADIRRLAGAA